MDPQIAGSLIGAGGALFGAAFGALAGFAGQRWAIRGAARVEHAQWTRDRRAEVYVDLLVEAQREWKDLQLEIAVRDAADDTDEFVALDPEFGDEIRTRGAERREQILSTRSDTRLPDRERALLGARVGAYASPGVQRSWNAFFGAALRSSGLLCPRDRAARYRARFEIGQLFDVLEATIICELNPDRPVAEA